MTLYVTVYMYVFSLIRTVEHRLINILNMQILKRTRFKKKQLWFMSKQVYNMLQHVLSLSNMTSSVKHSELFFRKHQPKQADDTGFPNSCSWC